MKKKLLLKDQEYQNYINFDEFLEEVENKKKIIPEEEVQRMKTSAA
eukprot:CAMPEP_0170531350 /NCGR_PEP_ID=MMETSP0209-20121228/60836_1 /TAXON_ID=665100 ORGANISM="Litonotus pictus, Strain P1" /NCGR_SAMPLE_ID=MMETSP0209 /ASSEMBLY_ACC=CAM_ASM_000301 /LENGTH=45 /DNA_ID= /DNA_START= /DNA_END= /DNA_ORIENTATION=